MLEGVVLYGSARFTQRFELGKPLDGEAPPQRKTGSRATQRTLQVIIGQAGPRRGLEIAAGREHRANAARRSAGRCRPYPPEPRRYGALRSAALDDTACPLC